MISGDRHSNMSIKCLETLFVAMMFFFAFSELLDIIISTRMSSIRIIVCRMCMTDNSVLN